MKIMDISMTIEPNVQVYKNLEHKKPVFTNSANFETGHHYETDLKMNLHTGTHMDAPLHMIEGGSTVEVYDLNRLVTPCKVFDLTRVDDMIQQSDLVGLDIQEGDFVLFKTKNSFEDIFNHRFISLKEDGAVYLSMIGIGGVGVDGLGIERDQPDHKTHKVLLEANVIIIEGLRLKDVQPGTYELIALPLKIANVEASPIRAVLIERS